MEEGEGEYHIGRNMISNFMQQKQAATVQPYIGKYEDILQVMKQIEGTRSRDHQQNMSWKSFGRFWGVIREQAYLAIFGVHGVQVLAIYEYDVGSEENSTAS